MDQHNYWCKDQNMLEQQSTYTPIATEPTKQKAKLISLLKRLKADTAMEENIYGGFI